MSNIFISYAHEDRVAVLKLYKVLANHGFTLWIDEKNLLPGQEWKVEIAKAIGESDVFIACLSKNSVSKRGYVQAELKRALEIAEDMPEGEIYIIPVRLDDCKIPSSLAKWQWLNYFETDESEKLFKAIQLRVKHYENTREEERKPIDSPNFQFTERSSSSPLDVLLQQMAGFKEHTMRDHAAVLKQVGYYFQHTPPSEVDQTFVVKFASYLGYLYNKMIDNGMSSNLADSVLTILAQINNQCRKIKTGIFDVDYFKDFKLLARSLQVIGNNLDKMENS